jgi:hypothetical protein
VTDFDDALDALEREVGDEPEQAWDDSLIPDANTSYRPKSDDLELDAIIESIDIMEAYRRWCGKSKPRNTKRTEGIKVSCPRPDHPDNDPSAWLNTEKNVWHCGSCDVGGDIFDIAAWHFGMDVPGYKVGQSFPELKRLMATDLGYTVATTRTMGRTQTEVIAAPSSNAVSDGADPVAPEPQPDADDEPTGPTISLTERIAHMDDDDDTVWPTIDWRTILPDESFMRTWMEITSQDSLPEEFYFWLGMMGLGFAVGRDVVLADNPVVRGNLFLCLYGPTGQGKTRAYNAMATLLREALPYDRNDPTSTGVFLVPSPGSSEALVDSFACAMPDGTPGHEVGIRGLVRFDELSTLIGRSSRPGNPMKPMLMEFFDGYQAVEHNTRTSGYVRAENHFASMVTTTQPRAIRSLLVQADADSGFANRWIFAAGPEKERVSYGRRPLELSSAVVPLRGVRGWGAITKGGRQLPLEGGALDLWDQFFHDVIVPSQRDDESNLLTRADLLLKKCILLFACDRHEAVPSVQCVSDALKLWDYLNDSYGLVSPEVGVGEYENHRNKIAQYVSRFQERKGHPPTLREISKGLAREHIAGDMLIKVIRTMQEIGELTEVTIKPQRGPAKVTYKLHAS